jgi:hypothetical protein
MVSLERVDGSVCDFKLIFGGVWDDSEVSWIFSTVMELSIVLIVVNFFWLI